MWEYASALEELYACDDPQNVLDVGCGDSLLGPAAHFAKGVHVTELEPKPEVGKRRAAILPKLLADDYSFVSAAIPDGPTDTFSAVFCISVLEHMPQGMQRIAWKRLANWVGKGGRLVVTVDCSNTKAGDPRERCTMFTTKDVLDGVTWLREEGLHVSDIDYALHPPQVNDYTFFRIIARRPA
jgi:SAM-dependent methyltransferase